MSWPITLTETRLGILISMVSTVLYLVFAETVPLQLMEGYALDARFRLRGAKSPGADIALVVIDDQSLSELGRWPWSRRIFGEMAERLSQAGAKVITFDLLFTEAETSISINVLQDLQDSISAAEAADLSKSGVALSAIHQVLGVLNEQLNPDAYFAESLGTSGNVLLPFSFVFGEVNRSLVATPESNSKSISATAYRTLHYADTEVPALPVVANGVLLPLASIAERARTLGHVNIGLGVDGAARYEYPVIKYRDAYYPSLAIQVAREFLGYALEETRVEFTEGLQLGRVWIPTDESMRMIINYYGPNGTFPTYSFVDVLRGRHSRESFDGKIVLVGAAAIGIGEGAPSPFAVRLSGSERIATVISNILRRDFVVRRNSLWLVDAAIAVLGGLILGMASSRLSIFYFSTTALIIGLVLVIANYFIFEYAGLWLNITLPIFVLIVTYTAILILRYLIRVRRERETRKAFGRYLHPAMVDLLCEKPDLLKLSGEKKELTVLFSDIRNFGFFADRLPAEELVTVINEYLTAMTALVRDNNGLLDKYVGDGLMSIYGAPVPSHDHGFQACQTALRMIEVAKKLEERWVERGLPALRIRIGINTGSMVIGNMGSDFHFDYTVMGDEVIIAARLEQANKIYGTAIIVGERTRALTSDRLATRELDLIHLKGRQEPVRIFELLPSQFLVSERSEFVKLFESGLEAYRAKRWAKAIDLFEKSLRLVPGDPPSSLFIQRCQEFSERPPPQNWNGAWPSRIHDERDTDTSLPASK